MSSKIAKVLILGIASGLFCLVALIEHPDQNAFSFYLYPDAPLSVCAVPSDTRSTRCIVASFFSILAVLGLCCLANVFISVIKRIAVYMIPYFRPWDSKNKVVHFRDAMFTVWKFLVCLGVERLHSRAPISVPIPLHEEIVAMCRDYGNLSLCEGNVADRMVLRLNNRLAYYATFGHDPTSNRIAAVQPHIYFTTVIVV